MTISSSQEAVGAAPAAAALAALRAVVDAAGFVDAGAPEAERYLHDWTGDYRGGALAVLRPSRVEEVQAIVRICAEHRVALIPVQRNDYTTGKSINRPATAILAGLGVVADSIGSYEELRPYVALDDWQGGLARYADDWTGEQPRLAAARAHLEHRYGAGTAAARWDAVLGEMVRPN